MKYIITFLLALLMTTHLHAIIYPIDPNICGDINNPGNGGLLVLVGIPTLDKVPPSPLAPEGDNVRLAIVYLPRGYETSTERYPVVYYLPGFEGDHTFFVCGDKLVLDDLINNKLITPIIVVSVDASLINGVTPDGLRNYASAWYVNSELNGVNRMPGLFEDFLVEDTVNFIDANFRTKADRAYRALAGQSMGGYGSTLLAMNHPDKFIGFGSESGTPLWAIATTDLAHTNTAGILDGALFSLNSLVQPEIPTSGPDTGRIAPTNGPNTFLLFSLSGALSPNLAAIRGEFVNPFVNTYFVDLPFQVNGDGTPVFTPGPFIGASTEIPGTPITFPVSLVLSQTAIERWREKDPWFVSNDPDVIETLQHQAFFLDGGNLELINARGARMLSVKLANEQVDHEYLLYNGKHTDCIVNENCSRNRTVFQMLSAVFSQNGEDPNVVRSKIIGTGTIIIEENAQLFVEKGTLLGIETLPPEVEATNINLQILDNGKVLIGDETRAGGGFQIGNLYSKARAFADPSLNDNSVQASIIINGPGALFKIGRQGFFGIGAGLLGQPIVPPDSSNYQGMSGLRNLTQITLDIQEGVFEHNQIASGLEDAAAVFALGPADNYTFRVNFPTGNVLGGANLATLPDNWRMQPVNIDQAGILEPGGIRTTSPVNFIDTATSTDDFFYKEEMASTGFYFNKSFRNVLASAKQLEDRGTDPIYEITTSSLIDFSTFIGAQVYADQGTKSAAIATVEDELRLVYLDIIENSTTIVRTSDIPFELGQQLDIPKILDLGAIGAWVETFGDTRELISVYDLEPCEVIPNPSA
ncbi:MAG: alpha/beta hydrolase [Candidatus Babeliales bacterium]